MKERHSIFAIAVAALAAFQQGVSAQVPQVIQYQGRVAVNGVPFQGTGQFKFALVDGVGGATYWSNDGTSTAGSEPAAAVSVAVNRGLYVAPLGDTNLSNMAVFPPFVLTNANVRLRVWFDGGTGSQQLSPDQTVTSVAYALLASTVADGSVSADKLAAGLASTTSSPNSLVQRDGSGNFSAGTITADLNGNASTATSAAGFTGALSGDVTGTQGATVVGKLNGNPVSSTVPTTGQTLVWNGSEWQPGTPSVSATFDRLDFRLTQGNGNGFETSNDKWTRAGMFIYRGTLAGWVPTTALAIGYTTNPKTYYRVRLYDSTNDKVIATSVQGNLGNSGSPAIVDLGALSDLPIGQAILEIQIIATDSNGDPDPPGKRKVGIHTFQLF